MSKLWAYRYSESIGRGIHIHPDRCVDWIFMFSKTNSLLSVRIVVKDIWSGFGGWISAEALKNLRPKIRPKGENIKKHESTTWKMSSESRELLRMPEPTWGCEAVLVNKFRAHTSEKWPTAIISQCNIPGYSHWAQLHLKGKSWVFATYKFIVNVIMLSCQPNNGHGFHIPMSLFD